MKNLFTLIFLTVSLTSFSQKKKSIDQIESNKLNLIKTINDSRLTIDFLVDKYARDTNDVASLRELAGLYYNNENLIQAFNLCQLLVRKDKSDTYALRMLAGIYEQKSNMEEAILHYQRLLAVKETPQDQYQLASLYFKNSNYKSCEYYITKVINTKSQEFILMTYQKEGKGYKQSVPVIAAAFNMLGFISIRKEDYSTAKRMCEKAVEIYPTFDLAIGNLEYIKGVIESTTTPN